MKVLIIAYLIYPDQTPRANRATELAKEFVRQGHEVTLYGVLGKYDYTNFEKDNSLTIRNLGRNIFSRINSDGFFQNKEYYITRFLQKPLGKLFHFPLVFLAWLTYKALRRENKNTDLLITVANPYPIHWGAALYRTLHANKKKKMTWVADCGDPYTGNPLKNHIFYLKYTEKWFCRKADFLTIPIEEARPAYFQEFWDKIHVIPQGFRFNEISTDGLYQENKQPTFIYAGGLFLKFRDPRPLLDYLSTLKTDFRFIIYTQNQAFIQPYKERLKDKLIINSYIPRHELLIEMSKADFLVNFENGTSLQMPSKLIDYAITKRPILSLDSNKELDKNTVNQFLIGDYTNQLIINNMEQYDIKNVVNEFIKLSDITKEQS